MHEKYEKISGARNGSVYGDGKYDGLWIRKLWRLHTMKNIRM